MILFFNGSVYSPGNHHSALAVEKERILAVGSDDEILNLEKPGCTKINLDGKCIFPGLTDSHLHLEYFSSQFSKINCETQLKEECLNRVQISANDSEKNTWLLGQGWNQNAWGGIFGTAHELDRISNDHPVFLADKSLHSAWVNTQALSLANIDANTPDPAGGTIQRDAQDNPTGILFENAVALVEKVIPQPDESQRIKAFKSAQTELHRMGITSVHDFDSIVCYETLQTLRQSAELSLRVTKSIPFEHLDHAIALGWHTGMGDDHLSLGSVKLFADGALGPQTAALFMPYEGNPANRGILQLRSDDIFEIGMKAADFGMSLAIHAIGDRAVNESLNGLSMLREYEKQRRLPSLNHRIEHFQMFYPDDLAKAALAQITASMQPIHLTTDMFTAEKHWGRRSRYAFAFSSLLTQKVPLIFGSDAPVESPNPFWGVHAAVTRRKHTGEPEEEGWNSKERISFIDAVAAYSTTPAEITGRSDRLGKLAPGFLADLSILEKNPENSDIDELLHLAPDDVMVDGKWVYHKN